MIACQSAELPWVPRRLPLSLLASRSVRTAEIAAAGGSATSERGSGPGSSDRGTTESRRSPPGEEEWRTTETGLCVSYALSEREIGALVATEMPPRIVHCGNGRTAFHTLARANEARALHRVIIGNDAPSGTGIVPLGILRVSVPSSPSPQDAMS